MTIRTKLFAMTYDRQMAGTEKAGLCDMRARLVAGAAGRVLEIGSGTGASLPWYTDAVESLALTDPEPGMISRLQRRAAAEAPLATVLRAPAEDLPFDDDSLARLQDRMNWLNRLVVCCDCNRPTLTSIRDTGFEVTSIDRITLPKAPKFVGPAVLGAATVPAGDRALNRRT